MIPGCGSRFLLMLSSSFLAEMKLVGPMEGETGRPHPEVKARELHQL
jgi:hypothetical protein